MLEQVVGHDLFSFINWFSRYNQVRIAKEDQLKSIFITEWRTFAYRVMPFRLTNDTTTFQLIILNIFKKFIGEKVAVFLDDWMLYSLLNDHLVDLQEMFQVCHDSGLCLNPKNCKFLVPFKNLLGHIVTKDGNLIDPDKVALILKFLELVTKKKLKGFLGLTRYY